MDGARTLPEYQATLEALLDNPAVPLTAAETSALREIVSRSRNGRRKEAAPPAAPHVRERASEIVALLGAAARDLRPRETQGLDDLVAGRVRQTETAPSFPVRLHRNGFPSR